MDPKGVYKHTNDTTELIMYNQYNQILINETHPPPKQQKAKKQKTTTNRTLQTFITLKT